MKRAVQAFGLAVALVVGAVAPAVAAQATGVVETVDPVRRAVTLRGDPRVYLLSRVMPRVAEAIRIEAGDRVILTFERSGGIDVVVHVEGNGMDLRAARRAQSGAVAVVHDPLRPNQVPTPAVDPRPFIAPRPEAAPAGAVTAVPVPAVTRGVVLP